LADGNADALPQRLRLAARYAEVIVTDPSSMSDELRTEMRDAFTPAEQVELTLTIALASAFSRTAITWGPPADMPVIEVPTPTP
jgi:alkylhydroperoxidase family enzyme